MPRVLLLVDGSWSIYRACAAHRELTHEGEYTGGLYGFMASLAKTMRETGATDVVVCRDVKPYRRSTAYPDYKTNRGSSGMSELRELYNVAEPQVHELLRVLGVVTWGLQGFESDDFIALAATHLRSRFERIYAHSNDSDLFQLLDLPGFAIVNNKGVVTRETVLQEFGLTPAEFTLATALSGTHNAVEGIPGVGEKRARAAVKDDVLMRRYRSTHAEVIDRNRELIRLPHAELPRLELQLRAADYSRQALYRYAARFGISVTAPMVEAFEQLEKL